MRKIEEFPKMSEIFSATAQGYFNMVLSQRSAGGENRAGSFFDEKPEKIRENLELAKWDVESFDEECGKAIFVSKDLEGTLGMINSSNVNKNSYVIPVDTKSYGKDDRGACSFLLLNNNEYKMKKTTETRVIVSFMNQETKQVDLKTPFCLTFFPGPDIDPTKSLMFFMVKLAVKVFL